MIEVFTTITDSYKYSNELKFSLSLFQRSLPRESHLHLIHRNGENASSFLLPAILDRLAKDTLPEFFLILKEPSLLVGKNAVLSLQQFLIQHSKMDCVLPSDIRGVPGRTYSPNYMTMRAFDAFVAGINGTNDIAFSYDGREPFMFLIRSKAFPDMEANADLFQLPRMLGDRTAISQIAYIHPFFDYHKEKREDIVELVPESVSTVLDIGCTNGGFGAFLKSQRACRVVGVEINPLEAKTAQNVLDKVIIGDALDVAVEGKYDCVTCLDVIEHFEEPSRLLTRIRDEFLCDKGLLILSVPNVGHWSIIEDLLAGRWDYSPAGILSNTHLRFFTRSSITGFLEENGFKIRTFVGKRVPVSENQYKIFQVLSDFGMEMDFQNLEMSNHLILAERL